MNISDLEKVLKELREEHGDLDVMVKTNTGTYSVDFLFHEVAEEGEYPADWDMPGGFEFIEIPVAD